MRRADAKSHVPIVRIGDRLLVSVQVELHDQLALALQNDLTQTIARHGARGVLIDVSSVEIIDSFIARILANIAQLARILGAATVVVGIQPAVAITLVELGIALDGIQTALDAERGMAVLDETIGRA